MSVLAGRNGVVSGASGVLGAAVVKAAHANAYCQPKART